MIQIRNLRKDFGVDTTLSDISLVINDGEHIGLIGPNGVGKSTLLKCIVGELAPDSGTIVRAPHDLTIGYLPQAFAELHDRTLGQVVAAAQADFVTAEADLQRAGNAMANAADLDAAMAAYDRALTRFEALGGYDRETRAASVLDGLGLGAIDPSMPVGQLSGGQKTRLGLATLLLREPDLLLLDEPTNHLDVDALIWLEDFVRSYPRAALIVSHDRAFLDRTVTRILALDGDTRTIRSYTGSYSDFAAAREHEQNLQAESYKRQQEYVERVSSDIARLKGEALRIELTTTSAQPSIRKFAKKKAQLAKSRERKLERYLSSEDRVEKPRNHWNLKLDFGDAPPSSRAVLAVESLSFAYPDAPPILSDVSFDLFYGERVALVGPNGAGKSTLLRLIEGRLTPQTGRVQTGPSIRMGVLSQEHDQLDPEATVLRTVLDARPMSETEARSFLHFFLFGGDRVFRRVGECSLGERSRLQLALLVLQGCNFLLLDEPLNHLDIEGREHFERALDAFDGTVLVIAHDRAFLHTFAERVLEVRGGAVRSYTDYDEYLERTAGGRVIDSASGT